MLLLNTQKEKKNISGDIHSFHACKMQSTGTLGGGGDGRTDRRMKGKGGVKVEGVLEGTEKIKTKVK